MAADDIQQQVLGTDETVIHTSNITDLIAATDRMLAQAQQTVRILSHDTEPELYGREEFIALLTAFITGRR